MSGTAPRVHLLTRYNDVKRVLRDASTFASEREGLSHPLLSASDGDRHRRLRSALQEALSRDVIDELRPALIAMSSRTASTLPHDRVIDLVEGYITPVVNSAFARLLGLADGDASWFYAALATGDARLDDELRQHLGRTDRPPPDVIGRLRRAGLDEDTELLPHVRMLLGAGGGTTIDLIAGTIASLLDDRARWSRVVDDRGLLDRALDESLRQRAPAPMIERRARRALDIGGCPIGAGDVVIAALASANRDPDVFADPWAFELGRDRTQPHLAFGSGPHSCLGAPWVRAVGGAAIDALLTQAPGTTLEPGGAERDRTGLVDGGLRRLAVRLGPPHL